MTDLWLTHRPFLVHYTVRHGYYQLYMGQLVPFLG